MQLEYLGSLTDLKIVGSKGARSVALINIVLDTDEALVRQGVKTFEIINAK
ncbi:hypothetical protein [Catenovulum sediminis]|uniref:Thioesterase domain-containing protein n=1 Tax=Catenovulum sediminis TaxID=1740262 RepID=A0ABV1RCR7_9ALTE|nr:hypothetical protein [Catenovulum sediminis]